MPLERADAGKTMRFDDGAAWLVLRTEINKGEADRINDLNSRTRMSAGVFTGESEASVEMVPNSAEVNRTLFDILAIEWSISEGRPTARDYDSLRQASAEWVDTCISEAIAAGRPGAAEGNSRRSSNGGRRKTSSKKPASSRTTSAAAGA